MSVLAGSPWVILYHARQPNNSPHQASDKNVPARRGNRQIGESADIERVSVGGHVFGEQQEIQCIQLTKVRRLRWRQYFRSPTDHIMGVGRVRRLAYTDGGRHRRMKGRRVAPAARATGRLVRQCIARDVSDSITRQFAAASVCSGAYPVAGAWSILPPCFDGPSGPR